MSGVDRGTQAVFTIRGLQRMDELFFQYFPFNTSGLSTHTHTHAQIRTNRCSNKAAVASPLSIPFFQSAFSPLYLTSLRVTSLQSPLPQNTHLLHSQHGNYCIPHIAPPPSTYEIMQLLLHLKKPTIAAWVQPPPPPQQQPFPPPPLRSTNPPVHLPKTSTPPPWSPLQSQSACSPPPQSP